MSGTEATAGGAEGAKEKAAAAGVRLCRSPRFSDAVTVVVVNWNGRLVLEKCLDSLKRQTFPCFSVTVVDNGSTDGSAAFIRRRYPGVDLIALEENVGFAKANNIALQAVRTPYAALLNNDAQASPGWLEALVAALKRRPAAWAAASRMVFADRPDTIDRAGDAYTIEGAGLLRGRGAPAADYGAEEWVFGPCAGAALYRMKVLEEIGGFDEAFFLLYEDLDLSFRAQLKGYRCIYVPDAVVYHHASYTIGRDSSTSVYYGHRNLEWVYIKNMPSSLLLKTLPFHLLYDVAALAYFLAAGRGKAYLAAKRDALLGLGGMLAKRRAIQKSGTPGATLLSDHLTKDVLRQRLWVRRMRSRRPGRLGPGASARGEERL